MSTGEYIKITVPAKTVKIHAGLARELLGKLDGKAPFDGPSNIVRGDGYFARSIEKAFGMTVAQLRKAVG